MVPSTYIEEVSALTEQAMKRCTILVTSDIHGYISAASYRTQEDVDTGLARLATRIKAERAQERDLILIDNGDLIQGTPLTYYAANFKSSKPHPAIAALSSLDYDAAVVGNHEFNYGLSYLQQVMTEGAFPWLSAGIVDEGTDTPAFGMPYIIKRCGEVKVAILGVTTHYIPNWEHPDHIAGLDFQDALNTVKTWVPRIRAKEEPDLMIVAYHGGFERDVVSGEWTERYTGENQGYAMCMEVEGIDMLITGHQHRMLTGEINGVSVIQPGCNGQALGKLEAVFERVEGRFRLRSKRAELIPCQGSYAKDQEVLEAIRPYEEQTQVWLDEKLGSVNGDMKIDSPHALRLADHPFIEFVNKVQMETAGADVSNTALLSEDTHGFEHTITMRDILTNFIYPNTLTVLRVSGDDIRKALEQSASYFTLQADGSIAVSRSFLEPKTQHYNYDMWEGIEYELDVSMPIGQRVVKLTRQGTPIEGGQTYEVVMNNYRAGGGGEYEMYRGKPVVREVTVDMSELIAGYIREKGTVEASCNHNWRVVASEAIASSNEQR